MSPNLAMGLTRIQVYQAQRGCQVKPPILQLLQERNNHTQASHPSCGASSGWSLEGEGKKKVKIQILQTDPTYGFPISKVLYQGTLIPVCATITS